MMEILLNLIYATRTGHWDLYVEVVNGALPWFFTYDRQSYSRYPTAHYFELIALAENYPDVYNQFRDDKFSVQMYFTIQQVLHLKEDLR